MVFRWEVEEEIAILFLNMTELAFGLHCLLQDIRDNSIQQLRTAMKVRNEQRSGSQRSITEPKWW